jgi:hypothetical protein
MFVRLLCWGLFLLLPVVAFVVNALLEAAYPMYELPSLIGGPILIPPLLLGTIMVIVTMMDLLKRLVVNTNNGLQKIGGPEFLDMLSYALLAVIAIVLLLSMRIRDIPENEVFWGIVWMNIVCAIYSLIMFSVKAVSVLGYEEKIPEEEEAPDEKESATVTDIRQRRTGNKFISKRA